MAPASRRAKADLDGDTLDSPLLILGSDDGEEEAPSFLSLALQEAKVLGKLAVPQSVAFLLGQTSTVITLAVVGKLSGTDALPFAAVGLASSISNITGYSLVVGMATGLDTVCGQAWGAGNKPATGMYLRRGLAIVTCVATAISLFWLYGLEAFLKAIQKDEALAARAAGYCCYYVPALYFNAWNSCCRRYQQAQYSVLPAFVGAAVSAAVHYPLTLAMGYYYGIHGAVAAYSVSSFVQVAILGGYVMVYGNAEAWGEGWDVRKTFSGWREYMNLAVPSTAMMCLEWWAFEMVLILAGWLPGSAEVNVGACDILFQVVCILFLIPYGFSGALATRMGNLLGEGNPAGARLSFIVGLGCNGCLLAAMEAALVLLGHRRIPEFYTQNPDIVNLVAKCVVLIQIQIVSDSTQCMAAGALRGQGRQHLGVLINIPAFWAIGLPLALYRGFALKHGVFGLWEGLICGTMLQCVAVVTATFRADWEGISEQARGRGAADAGAGAGAGKNDEPDGPQSQYRAAPMGDEEDDDDGDDSDDLVLVAVNDGDGGSDEC